MTEKKTGFWNSIPLVVIRWLVFLPIGLVILLIAESLAILLVGWVLSWASGVLLVFILIGGGSMLMGLIAFTGYGCGLLTGILCPNPKVGIITTGIVFLLWAIALVYMAVDFLFIVVGVVFTIEILWGFAMVYGGWDDLLV